MLEIKLIIKPEDTRYDAVLAALLGAPPAPEPQKAAKKAIEKPVIPAQEVKPAEEEKAATEGKQVTLEAIREKITSLVATDADKYKPAVKDLLAKFGQKSASNLVKTDYESFYAQLCKL